MTGLVDRRPAPWLAAWHAKLLGRGLTEGDESEVLFKLVRPQPVHNQVLLHRGGHCLRVCRSKHAAARREPPSTSTLLPARPRGAAACNQKQQGQATCEWPCRTEEREGTRPSRVSTELPVTSVLAARCALQTDGVKKVETNRGFKSLSASRASSAGARSERRRRRTAHQPISHNHSALARSGMRNAPLCTPSSATFSNPHLPSTTRNLESLRP